MREPFIGRLVRRPHARFIKERASLLINCLLRAADLIRASAGLIDSAARLSAADPTRRHNYGAAARAGAPDRPDGKVGQSGRFAPFSRGKRGSAVHARALAADSRGPRALSA